MLRETFDSSFDLVRHQLYACLDHLELCHRAQEDSPILQVASFSEAEIASLGAKTIAALNCFTILYNSCSLMVSVLTWPLIRKNLLAGQSSAFWMLVIVIGFVEGMAFLASSYIGHGRWQVNVVQSFLYLVGIGLSGWSLFKGEKA